MRPIGTLWICVTLTALLAGCKKPESATLSSTTQPTTAPAQVRVAAAADLQFALADLLKSFEQAHPEIHVSVTYGSSGNFFSQLSNHAPFDVFLSADAGYPQKLVEQGLAQPSSLFHYATGKIVLWVLKDSRLDIRTGGLSAL